APAPPPLPARRKRRLVAQATPPSPPSPPAPPAPPDVSGSRHTSSTTRVHSDGGSTTHTSSWSDDGRSVTLTTHGKVEWNDDASDIAAISPGGSFELSVSDGARHWHVEVFPAAGSMTRTLLVDGVPRPG